MIDLILGVAGLGTGAALIPVAVWLYGLMRQQDSKADPVGEIARRTANVVIAGAVLGVALLMLALAFAVLQKEGT